MPLSYPLIPPASPTPRTFNLGSSEVVGVAESPFTRRSQIQRWPGNWWDLQVALPPMVRAEAEAWIAFLLALRGIGRTFTMGDPMGATPRGSALGTPVVHGYHNPQIPCLATRGWTANQNGVLLAGDYVQVGTGSSKRLYKNLADANADSSGVAYLPVFPALREAISDGATIVLQNPSGCFRLASNRREWTVDYTRTYGLDFKAVESLPTGDTTVEPTPPSGVGLDINTVPVDDQTLFTVNGV